MKCSNSTLDYQPLARSQALVRNLSLPRLFEALPQAEHTSTVYLYVIATIENYDDRLRQRGSGPNFQGGLITLCTCKHYMRTFMSATEWAGKWVAGFTGMKAGKGRNALVYLMQVGHAFESHYDMWFSPEISDSTKQTKLASRNKFGDLYQPVRPGDRFDPQVYERPHPEHSHLLSGSWRQDIDYRRKDRSASHLVGNVRYSFVWDKPMLFYPAQLHRGQKKLTLGDLLQHLKLGDM